MDEWIFFDTAKELNHPSGILRWGWYFIDGGDLRYGRLVFWLGSLAGAIPSWIWGDPGQITAVRMLHACMVLAVAWLVADYAKGWWKIAALGSILLNPISLYLATMPKTEPLQMLLVLMALRVKDPRMTWAMTGLAVASKISGLIFLPVVFLLRGRKGLPWLLIGVFTFPTAVLRPLAFVRTILHEASASHPHYLWPIFVLLCCLAAVYARKVTLVLCFIFLPWTAERFLTLESRVWDKAAFQKIETMIDESFAKNGRKIMVIMDPSLPCPKSDSRAFVHYAWGGDFLSGYDLEIRKEDVQK